MLAHPPGARAARRVAGGHGRDGILRGGERVRHVRRRPTGDLFGRGAEEVRRQLGLAAALRGGDGPADDAVGRAVIEPEAQRQLLGQVGGRGEMPGRLLAQHARVRAESGQHGGPQADEPPGQVDRAGHLAAGVEPVVGAGGGGQAGGEQPGEAPDQRPGPAPQHRQRVRVALLRHQHARPAQRGVERHVAERGAGEDLEVPGELPDARHGDRRRGDRVGQGIDRPHRVARVQADGAEPEQPGESGTVQWQPGTARPARARGRDVRLAVCGLDPAGVPHRLLGEPAQIVTEG